jgi:hypothetical protein
MGQRDALLDRLAAIGRSLAATQTAQALIGLGSVGRELDRLDDYSDLDFFVVVDAGRKAAFLDDLSWLKTAAPLAYQFRNTPDGYKFLFTDGLYGEMAVFSPDELAAAAFTAGRVIWRREDVSETIGIPRREPPRQEPPEIEWLLGEALTNLYVGLGRFRRGEKLSAFRFIQHYAVDRVVDLASLMDPALPRAADPFDPPRRFEQRHTTLAGALPALMQGYERSPESAAAILALLRAHFRLDLAMTAAIESLLPDRPDGRT